MVSFRTIDTYLPEELADKIARIAHKNAIVSVLAELRLATMSVLDRAIEEGAIDIIKYVRNKMPPGTVEVMVDHNTAWYATFILFGEERSRFYLYYHFIEEMPNYSYVLMEGCFNDKQKIDIDRFYCLESDGSEYRDYDSAMSANEYNPFNLVIDSSWVTKEYKSYKEWLHPTAIIDAFRTRQMNA